MQSYSHHFQPNAPTVENPYTYYSDEEHYSPDPFTHYTSDTNSENGITTNPNNAITTENGENQDGKSTSCNRTLTFDTFLTTSQFAAPTTATKQQKTQANSKKRAWRILSKSKRKLGLRGAKGKGNVKKMGRDERFVSIRGRYVDLKGFG